MNIAHIVYAKYWGGGEQYVYNFCKEENRLGYKNIVIADNKRTNITNKFNEVATVASVPVLGLKRFFALRKYLSIIDKYRIDIINCHSGTMSGMCAILKILRPNLKLVMYKHNLKPSKKDFYHRWLYKKIDAFICVSRLVHKLQLENAYPENISKYHLIYNGIDIFSFQYRKGYFPSSPIKIGYAGRIVENKGILVLSEAIDLLNNKYNFPCEIYIAGEGERFFVERFHKFIADKKLEKIFHYQKFLKDMSKFYQNIDIFVLPSIVRESFGLVLCEAMYSGVPVITTNSGAQTEIVSDNVNGFIVIPGDVESIAQKIMALVNNSEKYRSIVEAGYLNVKENFTVEIMIKKINTLFLNLLNEEITK